MLIATVLAVMLVVRSTTTRCAVQIEGPTPGSSQPLVESARHGASPEEQREIAKLIEELVLIDKPDFGLSPTLSGTQFAPIASSRKFNRGRIMINHGIETSPMVRRLVELGPKALPALLKALDDSSETKLVMEHDLRFGAMWYGREVPINAANAREAAARVEHSKVLRDPNDDSLDRLDHGPPFRKYTITRGDVAFVIIGQIVGRGYEAAHYQPSACMIINSPSQDHAIADAVRAIWSSDDPATMLFDSLSVDSKSPSFPGAQDAMMRLSYYFAAESRASLVQRIDGLDVRWIPWKSPGYQEGWRKQDEANGGRASEILAAVTETNDPAVVAAILRVIERTDDVAVLGACASASVARANADILITKMIQVLAKPPRTDQLGPFGDEYELLSSAARLCPERAQPLFKLWLGHGTANCKRTVVHALAGQKQPLAWAVEILSPLLGDKKDTGWEYGPAHDRHPIRICDEAAQVLAQYVPDAAFELEGDPANLDEQIAVLKRRIAGEVIEPKRVEPKKGVAFTALPKREPLAAFDLDKIIDNIHAISDANTLYAEYGWSEDIAVIDVAAKAITSVTRIDDWGNDGAAIQPVVGDQIHCYYGDKGEIVVRELRTGKELRRIATPFHGGDINSQDPLHVRGWIDAYVTENGKWLVAATPDGALHSVDLTSGEHRVVSPPLPESTESPFRQKHLVAVRGTSRFLIPCSDDEGSLGVWDVATNTLREITRVPTYFWKEAWGRFAHHRVNGGDEIWDLEARESIPLQLPQGVEIADLVCDPASARAWIATKAGLVYVIDLNTGAATSILLASPNAVGLVRLSLSSNRKLLFFSGDQTEYDSETREATNRKTRIAIFEVADVAR